MLPGNGAGLPGGTDGAHRADAGELACLLALWGILWAGLNLQLQLPCLLSPLLLAVIRSKTAPVAAWWAHGRLPWALSLSGRPTDSYSNLGIPKKPSGMFSWPRSCSSRCRSRSAERSAAAILSPATCNKQAVCSPLVSSLALPQEVGSPHFCVDRESSKITAHSEQHSGLPRVSTFLSHQC